MPSPPTTSETGRPALAIRRAVPADVSVLGALAARLVAAHHGFDARRFVAAGPQTAGSYGSYLGRQLAATDAIVLVRGRVDHKEAGKSCVIVQDAERFEPSEAEIEKAKAQVARMAETMAPEPIRLRVDAGRLQPAVIGELRDLFERYPGDAEFVLEMDTRSGLRCLRFGDGYKVAGRDAGLRAELRDLLGPAIDATPAAA